MSSNYQQKKMMNALGAIDTKGNIVLEQFQDGTALLFQPGNAQPFCVRSSRTPASDGSRRISGKSSKRRVSHRQNSTCSPSSWAIQDFGSALSTEIFETT